MGQQAEPSPEPETPAGPPANWKAAFEQSLWANYEVTPAFYEDLGNDIYQVYVYIDDNPVPFVILNAMTGEYHG